MRFIKKFSIMGHKNKKELTEWMKFLTFKYNDITSYGVKVKRRCSMGFTQGVPRLWRRKI